jgi:hypothetical protein
MPDMYQSAFNIRPPQAPDFPASKPVAQRKQHRRKLPGVSAFRVQEAD